MGNVRNGEARSEMIHLYEKSTEKCEKRWDIIIPDVTLQHQKKLKEEKV